MLRARVTWLLAMCAALPPLRAQAIDARSAAESRAATEPDSREWFEFGCDQFEAELEFDVRAALATAEALAESAQEHAQHDRYSVAAALAELALSTLEGPALAGDWSRAAAEEMDDAAPASFRVRRNLARSRSACLRDESVAELEFALDALRAARDQGDRSLHTRAVWNAQHATDDVSGVFPDALRDELHALARRQPAASKPVRLLIYEFKLERDELPVERKLARLMELAQVCIEQGDRRALESVYWGLAAQREATGDVDGALSVVDDATAVAATAGHRRALVNSLYMSALYLLEYGRLDAAAERLADAEAALEGRGMPNMEGFLLDAHFRLAIARHDSQTILELAEAMESRRREEQTKLRERARLQEQLLGSERTRIEYDRKLAEERARSERTLARMSRGLWAGALLALAAVTAILVRARRRLLRSNEALRREIERAESETRARRSAEERMRRLERTESLGLFASGIAHDFNNLMVGVIGNAELLRSSEGAPERAQRLGVIVDAGERAARLCSQLQTFVGNEDLALERLDLAAIVRESGPVLASLGSLEVDVEEDGESLEVLGLRVQLEQALLNLVANARDARAKRVRVRVGAVELSEHDFAAAHVRGAARAGRFACIDVEDDGDGMDHELLERIFDPFFTTRFPGRGLGLAVVFGAMRRHDGLVLVTSALGRGSRFRFCIPLADAAQLNDVLEPTPPRALPPRPATIETLNVLAIDDEPDVRDFVRVAMESRGHSVALADDRSSAEDALASLHAPTRRVALVDLTMPAQEGREVALRLRALDPQLAIVLMSGHAAGQLQDTAQRIAADATIAKPFTAGELERALDLAITRRLDLAAS